MLLRLTAEDVAETTVRPGDRNVTAVGRRTEHRIPIRPPELRPAAVRLRYRDGEFVLIDRNNDQETP